MALKIDAAESGRILTVMTLIIASFFLLDLLFIYLTRARYNNGLADSIEEVLNSTIKSENEKYFVGDRVQLRSMLDTSCALYKVQSAVDKDDLFVVVARIATYAGPFPAVFLYNSDSGARFVSFMNISNSNKDMLNRLSQSQLHYWKARVEKMLGGATWQTQ